MAFRQCVQTAGLAAGLNTLVPHGYALLPSVLTPAAMKVLRLHAQHILSGAEGGVFPGSQKGQGVVMRSLFNAPTGSSASYLFSAAEQLAARVASALGIQMEFAGHSDLHANTSKGWHRDLSARLKLDPWGVAPDGTTHRNYRLILYLECHAWDTGALLVMPGTHLTNSSKLPEGNMRKRLAPARQDLRDSRVRRLQPRLGDALLIDHRILHRGGETHTGRHLVQYSFGAASSPFTADFRARGISGLRHERECCPASLAYCICFDHQLQHNLCRPFHGCGKCGRSCNHQQ